MTSLLTTIPVQKAELLLSQLDSLPSPDPIVGRLLAGNDDAASLREMIESDAGLAARLRALLAAPDMDGFHEAGLEGTLQRRGPRTVRCCGAALKIMDVFGIDSAATAGEFSRPEFWKHSIAVGCAARLAAGRIDPSLQPDELFVIGLLHDIGKIALHAVMPKSYARVARKAEQTQEDLCAIERSILGVDHTLVGHRLADRWGLPPSWVECIWLHHQAPAALPVSIADHRMVRLVQFGDAVARELGLGYSGNHRIQQPSTDLARGLGLSMEQRQEVIDAIRGDVEEVLARLNSSRSALEASSSHPGGTHDAGAGQRWTSENRGLARKAEYWSALAGMTGSISPRSSVREVCAAVAESFRQALGVPGVVVFAPGADHGFVEVGVSDGTLASEVVELEGPPIGRREEIVESVRQAAARVWVNLLPRTLESCANSHRRELGPGALWMIPAICRGQWVGGVCFAADPGRMAAMQSDSGEIGALSAIAGLVIAQASAQTATKALSDELAEINRRWSAMQSDLLRVRTLEGVVAMASGAAHELNNPLAVISGRAQMLRSAVATDDQRETLDTIIRQAHAASDIVSALMEFADPPSPNPEAIDLRDLFNRFRDDLMADGVLGSSDLALEIAPNAPAVWFDRDRLRRIFRELIDNALEAASADPRVLCIKVFPDLTEENAVVVVADRGRGMSPEVLNHAEDPFFSSRPAGRGRGLGLARVARWLAVGGGSMRIRSRPNEGTEVELRLPTGLRTGT